MGTCPYCHEEHGIRGVCEYRPDRLVGDYDDPCPDCSYPIGFHGILGVVFCAGCGGALRTRNEMDVGSIGFAMACIPAGLPPRGDGGPDFYYEAWQDGPALDRYESRDLETELCFLCKRQLPISAFFYSARQYQRDHGGWRCSTRCRRCQRQWLESLYRGRPERSVEQTQGWEVCEDEDKTPRPAPIA